MERGEQPPKAVRNFFLEAVVAGKVKPVRCGPRGRKGGMRIALYQRRQGLPELAMEIVCHVYGSDILQIEVVPRTSFAVSEGVLRIAPSSR